MPQGALVVQVQLGEVERQQGEAGRRRGGPTSGHLAVPHRRLCARRQSSCDRDASLAELSSATEGAPCGLRSGGKVPSKKERRPSRTPSASLALPPLRGSPGGCVLAR